MANPLLLGYNPRRAKKAALEPLVVGSLRFPVSDGETLKHISVSAWAAYLSHPDYGKQLQQAIESGVLRIIPPLGGLKLDEAEDAVKATNDLTILEWWKGMETRKTAAEFLRDRIEELKQDAN